MNTSTVTATYGVTGMNCGHCSQAVTTEVSALPGVREVEVDVAVGAMTVTSEQLLDEALLRDAVTEAGFELTGAV